MSRNGTGTWNPDNPLSEKPPGPVRPATVLIQSVYIIVYSPGVKERLPHRNPLSVKGQAALPASSAP